MVFFDYFSVGEADSKKGHFLEGLGPDWGKIHFDLDRSGVNEVFLHFCKNGKNPCRRAVFTGG